MINPLVPVERASWLYLGQSCLTPHLPRRIPLYQGYSIYSSCNQRLLKRIQRIYISKKGGNTQVGGFISLHYQLIYSFSNKAIRLLVVKYKLLGGGGHFILVVFLFQKLVLAILQQGHCLLVSQRGDLLQYASHVACLHMLTACASAQNLVSALNSNASSLPPL